MPEVALIYDGVDKTSTLKGLPSLSMDAEKIVCGGGQIQVINTGGDWNSLITERTETRKRVELKYNGNTVFVGITEDAYLINYLIDLTIKDRMLELLEKTLGDNNSPVDYSGADYNPADMAWDILTTHGGLDATASSDNPDIDYNSWDEWKTNCATLNFVLRAKFTGQSIKEALSKIAELTNSYIYVGTDGKFKFVRFIPPFAPSGGLQSVTENNMINMRLEITHKDLCNWCKVFYGYDPATNTWAGSYIAEDTGTQSIYLAKRVYDDTVVWHATSTSAQAFADRVVDKYKYPLQLSHCTLILGDTIFGPGAQVDISCSHYNYSEVSHEIIKITRIDLENGLVDFIARNISDEVIKAFFLDDPYWGLLDQDYNPLY